MCQCNNCGKVIPCVTDNREGTHTMVSKEECPFCIENELIKEDALQEARDIKNLFKEEQKPQPKIIQPYGICERTGCYKKAQIQLCIKHFDLAQVEACFGLEKQARADEKAKMFSELDELQEFLEADMWQAIHHKTELITEKKLQAYLQRHFNIARKELKKGDKK